MVLYCATQSGPVLLATRRFAAKKAVLFGNKGGLPSPINTVVWCTDRRFISYSTQVLPGARSNDGGAHKTVPEQAASHRSLHHHHAPLLLR